jgi:hypothetical protein
MIIHLLAPFPDSIAWREPIKIKDPSGESELSPKLEIYLFNLLLDTLDWIDRVCKMGDNQS